MKKSFQNLFLGLAMFIGLVLAAPLLNAQVNQINPSASAVVPQTQSVETGPILDVVPYVLSDGFTIHLALIPSDTEFGGYDQLQLPQFSGAANANVVQLPTVLPKFTVRQVVTTVNVWDNQTVVLGGLITSTANSTKDKVPIIGDLPLVGRLFQSQSKQTTKNNLMVFVTATIVDPAGNRVHTDDQLPFAQSGVPEQPKDTGSVSESTFRTGPILDVKQ